MSAVPNPALAIADADYVSKMQANLDYLRDLLILQTLATANISATAGIASAQIAQYGIAGTSLNTGASGVPTAAIVTGAVTEPKYGAASIVEADIDYSSAKFVRTGATGIKIVRGQYTTTGSLGAGSQSYTLDVTNPTSGAFETVAVTQTILAFATMRFTSDPSKPYMITAAPVAASTQILVTIMAPETISIAGSFYWIAFTT